MIIRSLALCTILFCLFLTEKSLSGSDEEKLSLVSAPLAFADNVSRELLLTETKSLRKILRPLNTETFKRKQYRYNAWGWSYKARAAILAYRIFGDIKHIEAVIEGIQYFTALPHWQTWSLDTNTWFREVTTTGLITIPIIDLLLLAQTDQQVASLTQDNQQTWREIVINRMDGFDASYRHYNNAGYFVTALDNSKIEALNHMAIYVVALTRLYQLTHEERYRKQVKELARFWLLSTTLHPNNSLSWPYVAQPSNMHDMAEVYWKASITIELPIAAYEIDAAISAEDLTQTQNTLANVISPEDKFEPFLHRINGKKTIRERLKQVIIFIGQLLRLYTIEITDELDKKKKLETTVTMWHLLDCVAPSIPFLDQRLFARNKYYYKATSRSLYGAVYGLYLREIGCEAAKAL